jgi:hypothetical protein
MDDYERGAVTGMIGRGNGSIRRKADLGSKPHHRDRKAATKGLSYGTVFIKTWSHQSRIVLKRNPRDLCSCGSLRKNSVIMTRVFFA